MANHKRTSFPRSPLVIEALAALERGEIPETAYYAFKSQYDTAKRRGITFLHHRGLVELVASRCPGCFENA